MMVIYGKIDKLRYGKPSFAPIRFFLFISFAVPWGERASASSKQLIFRHCVDSRLMMMSSWSPLGWFTCKSSLIFDSLFMQIKTSIFLPRSGSDKGGRIGTARRGRSLREIFFDFVFSSICTGWGTARSIGLLPYSGQKCKQRSVRCAVLAHCLFFTPILLLTTTRAIYLWKMIFMAGVFVFKRLFHNSKPALPWREGNLW